jgi:flavin reductase (DIM6/NTAB) family NADH-FMN oxidoreductase RutF
MTVAPDELRFAMRQWPTGVTIVSAHQNRIAHGMTVSSFASVSLEPPLVLISLEQKTRTHSLINRSGTFGVTILAADQQEISDRFAGRDSESDNRYTGLETHTLVTGSPFLTGYLACLDCRVVTQSPHANHTIFIGEVLAIKVNAERNDPLIYFNQAYCRLQE